MFTLLLVLAVMAIMAVTLSPLTAAAQDRVLSREIEFFVQTASGAPKGCGMQFTYVFEDKTNKAGQIASMTGSLTWYDDDKGHVVPFLKLIGFDFPGGPIARNPTPFSIREASITVDGQTFHAIASPCEDSHAFCGGFSMLDGVVISHGVEGGAGPTLNFNRDAAALDTSLPFDFLPGETQDRKKWGEELKAYGECGLATIEHAKSILGSVGTSNAGTPPSNVANEPTNRLRTNDTPVVVDSHPQSNRECIDGDMASCIASAERGDANAQIMLGLIYESGTGVPVDAGEAMKWLSLAAAQGRPDAQSLLGFLYETGRGTTRDYAAAVKLYRLAAAQGDPDGQVNLGRMFASGNGVQRDYVEAAKWFRAAAESGNIQAHTLLGGLYAGGFGVKRDYAEALEWYRAAAEAGDTNAQTGIGFMYEKGHGVPIDYVQAASFYTIAANQGNAVAQLNLATLYEHGLGVQQSDTMAAKLYNLSAAQDDAKAQTNLCRMYTEGRGVALDYVEAIRLCRLAAAKGEVVAESNLGAMYANGQGVPRDYVEALKWLRLAADQGYSGAQTNLGINYAKGQGVQRNFVIAYGWFSLASAQGDNKAHELLNGLERYMTPAQIADAQKMARDWLAAHPVKH
ncbi:MAG: hypothetical protein P4L80_16725 [Xanthobacteraceae bacterium]|nr:hypothetical protein [Xanthobacteraceae bacterium]